MERRSKYNVGKTPYDRTYNDIVFDSVVEMNFYRDVVLPRVANGDILQFELQKKYILQNAFVYKDKKVKAIEYLADFYIIDKNGKETVIDIKGCPDASAKLKRKIFWYVYPNIDYVWVGFSRLDGGWTTFEKITAGRKQRKKEKQKAKEQMDLNGKKAK